MQYNPSSIEPKWQAYWKENQTFKANDAAVKSEANPQGKPPYYVLDMFPYPSGAGLHIGHPEGYTASDILGRYKKAQGFEVLHPMGWDAFGLPAEQHAIKTGVHPAENTANNIENFRRQIERIGFGIDWSREVNTTDPAYVKWTQWIFCQLFKHGLAYVDDKPVWWCPALGTVLANEEVIDGVSERGSHPVERRALRQWVLKITDYAERLLDGLKDVDWPTGTKVMQEAWIGKSTGAHVTFTVEGMEGEDANLTVFTTRPDTLCGATFMVIAPEHPLVNAITIPQHAEAVNAYVQSAAAKSDLDRSELQKDKTGVFTGAYAINPANGKRTPIWVADYVLMSYGTGAIMAVPAHDERDFAFAKKYGIKILPVIAPKGEEVSTDSEPEAAFTGAGVVVNSGQEHTGKPSEAFKAEMVERLQAEGKGKATINYKLRDWLFSRQRYWGEPFPIVWVSQAHYQKIDALPSEHPLKEFWPKQPVTYVEKEGEHAGETFYAVALPASELPLRLPEVESYEPVGTGESPLATAQTWLNTALEVDGESIPATRETNTMPQWAGSCWYYLRYLDNANSDALCSHAQQNLWGMPQFYIGGAEHAVLHLLYARFWHQFLFDIGVVTQPEPFEKLFHQGMILGEDGQKMSKSRGNVINPDDIIDVYGADALRLYEMFLGPLDAMKPWNTQGIEGVVRFLKKAWRELTSSAEATAAPSDKIQEACTESEDLQRLLHQSIQKVGEDIEHLRFNTAISQLMVLLNGLAKAEAFTPTTAKIFVQLVAPFAPHLGEELWQVLGETGSVSSAVWPTFNAAKCVANTVNVVFQVNGKVRAKAEVPANVSTDKAAMLTLAKENERVQSFMEGKELIKEIIVPGKLVNLVVKG